MEDYRSLSPDWITEGNIDLEYKSYLLLAYLQKVKGKFSKLELYPPLKDLIIQLESMEKLKQGKEAIYSKTPKTPTKLDLEELKIVYDETGTEEAWMQEIDRIIEFSLPLMKESIIEGKDLYKELEELVKIEPVGVLPIMPKSGFAFFKNRNKGFVDVYSFGIKKIEYKGEIVKGIYTQFLETIKKGFTTLENIKLQLSKKYSEIKIPAAYFVKTGIWLPREATLLPIAKRKILASVKV